jgi:FtsZ-interacting cell division protein ZipA
MDTDSISVSNQMSPGVMNILIMLGILALVSLIAFFWAFAVRRRKDRIRKHHHHHHHRKGYREQLQQNVGGLKELFQQHRHHHRQHRSPNPTLAQTGGLPPIRETGKPPSPPPSMP